MSQKANYFKLGLFVIGAIVAGVVVLIIIGTGRWFERKVTIETYFNESVQGLDIGSKMKYRGVDDRRGHARSRFTYTKYQQDLPMSAARALRAGRGAARSRGWWAAARRPATSTEPGDAADGGREGPARAPRAAGHHRHELPRDRLRRSRAAGAADRLDARQHLHPERAVDGHGSRQRGAATSWSGCTSVDIEGTVAQPQPAARSRPTTAIARDRHAKRSAQTRERTLGKLETTLDDIAGQEAVGRGDRAHRRAARRPTPSSRRRSTIRRCRSCPTTPPRRCSSVAEARGRSEARRRRSRTSSASLGRFDRIFGGGEADLATTIDNLRQITDNLRDLTEDAKRYPANVIFGAPPRSAGAHPMKPVLAPRASTRSACSSCRGARRLLGHAARRRSRDVPARAGGAAGGGQAAAASLRVGTVNVAAPFRGTHFVYREGELQVRDRLLQRVPRAAGGDASARCDGAGALERAKVFRASRRPLRPRRHRLGARRLRVVAVTATRASRARRTAEVTIRYYLFRRRSAAPACRCGRTTTASACRLRVRTPRRRYAAALNTAFAQILADLARDLAAAELPKS